MKILTNQTIFFHEFIGTQKPISDKLYTKMQYVVTCEDNGIYLAYNLLTTQLVELTEKEYQTLLKKNIKIKDAPIDLIEKWFLVPEDFEARKLHEQFSNILAFTDNKEYINNFLIFSTTNCNARCFYCYENGIEKIDMSDDVAKDAAKYIIEKSKGETVILRWFGGEPTCNTNAMDIISNVLIENNIEFYSSMVSNGYLFDEKMARKAFDLWKVRKIQITLDGTQNVYNTCKNYIDPKDDPFNRVIRNIVYLSKTGIDVKIRINLGFHNVEDIKNLVDYLIEKFEGYQNIKIYIALLYDIIDKSPLQERGELYKKADEYRQLLFKHNLFEYKLPSSFKQVSCIADNKHGTTITPKGEFGRCEHYSHKDLWGSLYSENIDYDILNDWKKKSKMFRECDSCELYPYCVTLEKCPNSSFRCDVSKKNFRINNIVYAMKRKYDLLNKQ